VNPYEATARAAQDGMQRASEGAAAWRPFMRLIVTAVATRLPILTMDDIREEMGRYVSMKPPPFNLMAYGAIMQEMQKNGTLTKLSGERKSRTVSQHRNRAVYASNIWAPGSRVSPAGVQPPLMAEVTQ
jgi:hypothetical protein